MVASQGCWRGVFLGQPSATDGLTRDSATLGEPPEASYSSGTNADLAVQLFSRCGAAMARVVL
jgi:hypothetical protein